MISMKILVSGSDNARIFAHPSFDDNDRNNSTNSTDPGSSHERECNLGDAFVENTGPYGCQVAAS